MLSTRPDNTRLTGIWPFQNQSDMSIRLAAQGVPGPDHVLEAADGAVPVAAHAGGSLTLRAPESTPHVRWRPHSAGGRSRQADPGDSGQK